MEGAGTMNSFQQFTNKEALLEELSREIITNLKEAITIKGHASFLVSGGSTPKKLFEQLSHIDMPWHKVTIGLVDDRWLNENHEDSNAKLVKDYLLQNYAKEAKFMALYEEDSDVYEAQDSCNSKMQVLYPFDVVVLGMGTDGHTASLFPHNEVLKEALDVTTSKVCIAVKPTTAPYERMSLTAKAILDAEHIYLHIEGEEKLAVYSQAIEGEDIYAMPVRAILASPKKTVEVYAL